MSGIPQSALDAAKAAYLQEFNYDDNAEYIARLVLESAAPHLMAQAWAEGATAQYNRVFSGAADLANPYRSAK